MLYCIMNDFDFLKSHRYLTQYFIFIDIYLKSDFEKNKCTGTFKVLDSRHAINRKVPCN